MRSCCQAYDVTRLIDLQWIGAICIALRLLSAFNAPTSWLHVIWIWHNDSQQLFSGSHMSSFYSVYLNEQTPQDNMWTLEGKRLEMWPSVHGIKDWQLRARESILFIVQSVQKRNFVSWITKVNPAYCGKMAKHIDLFNGIKMPVVGLGTWQVRVICNNQLK